MPQSKNDDDPRPQEEGLLSLPDVEKYSSEEEEMSKSRHEDISTSEEESEEGTSGPSSPDTASPDTASPDTASSGTASSGTASSGTAQESGSEQGSAPSTGTSRQKSTNPTEPAPSASKLKQHLNIVLESGPTVSAGKPKLSTKPNAYVSTETESALRRTISVLETRYGSGFSKSLFVDYALRIILLDVYHNAEESEIVKRLDEIFGSRSETGQ